MTELQAYCPYCGGVVMIDDPPVTEKIKCPSCGKLCDWWADGDIGPGLAYYLTKSPLDEGRGSI